MNVDDKDAMCSGIGSYPTNEFGHYDMSDIMKTTTST